MKTAARLYLSKNKQKALSLLHRFNDVRNDLAIDSRFKQGGSDNPSAIRDIAIEEVIEDMDFNDLRVTVTAPWADGDRIACTASPAYGSEFDCESFVIASRSIDPCNEQAAEAGGRTLAKLLVTIKIPKRITSYAMTIENAAVPESRSYFILRESTYGEMLHENGMLVLTAEYDCTYPEWFEEHKVRDDALAKQRLAAFEDDPIFSIIVPLYKTPIGFFDDMVQSVLAQSYPFWQLVLVNASPEQEKLCEAVARIAEQEERVTVVTLKENLGITLNTNAGIRASIGDFICFFDHDDIIEPDILFEYAKAINEHPETDVLYCDEDKLTPNGEFMHPFFKPDYSPDLLHCHNYICHMLAVRSSILAQFEPAGADVDGAQDYNCVLRASEKARYIHHVRKVLYHWRINPTSVASDSGNKPYATYAGQLALERHFERLGIGVRIDLRHVPFRYNAIYRIDGDPLVSIIIPSCDDRRLLEACVASIARETSYANYEVVIVDCRTTDEQTLSYYESALRENGEVRIVKAPSEKDSGATGAAQAFACGASQASGDYLVLLSHDAEIVTPDWLSIMLGYLQREEVGCVGARIMCPDGTIFHAGIGVGGDGVQYLNRNATKAMVSYFGLRDDVLNVSAVSSSCMMTRKDLFTELGGFDPSFSGAYQGIDYCLRVRKAGKVIVYTPFAEINRNDPYHEFGDDDAAIAAEESRNIALLQKSWPSYYSESDSEGDPYYSINLQKTGIEGRFFHLRRDYGVTVVLGRQGLEYRRSAGQTEA